MTPEQLTAEATAMLNEAGISNPRREARLLWQAAFPRRYIDNEELADGTTTEKFFDLVRRRAAREPLSHLVGYRDFYAHRFYVNSDVLDPRPDTETLIVTALEGLFDNVLDLGTGSGCILLSLLAERAGAVGVGADISDDALAVARKNCAQLELETRATFVRSDWFDQITGKFDLIVSNPPYIALDEMDDLQPEVRLHEPRIALTDEADGLSAYRLICNRAPQFLTAGGRLMVEIGPTQAQSVKTLMQEAGLIDVNVVLDLDGRDRVVSGNMPK
ncbi:peptide chain release factor N(5)-glutamine methyltransferase [Loktanella sp. S4079]|uniref:peptide chain release factor N(5)-glutamine methyltransferase n=1 Tax=Loktanella sp. S4079 TaxID=579483 RepID=UPI00061E864F|nr:peptide chain release factor N(5)-glutamine methyltransferase [Loktanella sp. S4079]KJZ20261.1 SAM-dependent methyltransferase [Loktanella sp. S4079]